jgi:hypothetical protein
MLQGTGIVAVIGELEAAGMPQHVGMDRERHPGGRAEALGKMMVAVVCAERGSRHRGSDGRLACHAWLGGHAIGPGRARSAATLASAIQLLFQQFNCSATHFRCVSTRRSI